MQKMYRKVMNRGTKRVIQTSNLHGQWCGVVQFAVWLLLKPLDPCSNPAISNFYEEHLFTFKMFNRRQ